MPTAATRYFFISRPTRRSGSTPVSAARMERSAEPACADAPWRRRLDPGALALPAKSNACANPSTSSVLRYLVAQHQAGAAGPVKRGAEFVGAGAGIRADAHLIEILRAAAAKL